MEFWNFGILEFWNFGISEFRNFGILEFWNFGILEFRNFGILEFWNFGISNQNSKIPKKSNQFFGNSKIPNFQNSKKIQSIFLEFPKFQKGIDYWNSKKLTGFFWNFGILEFRNFGILEFWNFGILEFWNFQPKFQKNPVIFLEIPKFQNSKKSSQFFGIFKIPKGN